MQITLHRDEELDMTQACVHTLECYRLINSLFIGPFIQSVRDNYTMQWPKIWIDTYEVILPVRFLCIFC